jgi:hypothetical protein
MTINTFSGCHPFNPQHLIDAYLESAEGEGYDRDEAAELVAELLEKVGEGRCLRCGAEFNDGEIPSGSKVTDCRCIPVCHVCGQAEAYTPLVEVEGPEDAWMLPILAPVCYWPIDANESAVAVATFRGRYFRPMTAVEVGDLVAPPAPSGCAAFGYDDTADREERER